MPDIEPADPASGVRVAHDVDGAAVAQQMIPLRPISELDRKSTRLNSSHSQISYAVFCLKKKKKVWCNHTPVEDYHILVQRLAPPTSRRFAIFPSDIVRSLLALPARGRLLLCVVSILRQL